MEQIAAATRPVWQQKPPVYSGVGIGCLFNMPMIFLGYHLSSVRIGKRKTYLF